MDKLATEVFAFRQHTSKLIYSGRPIGQSSQCPAPSRRYEKLEECLGESRGDDDRRDWRRCQVEVNRCGICEPWGGGSGSRSVLVHTTYYIL